MAARSSRGTPRCSRRASSGSRTCGARARRRSTSCVAAGAFDGFFELNLSSWDFAAGGLLVREAGGVVTDWEDGDRWPETGNVLAGNPDVHAASTEIAAITD